MQMNSFLWEEKFAYCVLFGYYLIKKQLRSEKTTSLSIQVLWNPISASNANQF